MIGPWQRHVMAQAPLYGAMGPPPAALDFNVGLFGGDPLLAMAGNAAMAQAMGAAGLMPAQFMPVQNFADQVLARQHQADQMAALRAGVAADRDTYMDVLRGVGRMTGRPPSLRQEQAAQSIAGGIAAAAPFLAMMMPETFDALHGSRGSAAVMALGLHRGGMLAQDAATGMTGMSGATAGAVAGEIHGRFFGPGADVAAFRGLSQGRLGLLYEDLQQRGLAGPSIAAFDARRQAELIAGATGRGGGDVERIRAAGGDEWDNLKRNFDARKVGERLQNLSGAVAAMRDIFGDQGHPNAPMRALVEGLNQLTQGGLATMAPGQLEKSVRMTQALARSTGMGIENAMAMMARGAGVSDALGIERIFGVQATQGAMAYGAAFGQVGRGDIAHFQAGDRDTMMLLDQRLRAQAAGSGMANQLNTALRIGDTLGDANLGQGARSLIKALRAGRTTFDDGAGNAAASVFQDESAFRRLMTASGVDESTLLRLGSQADTNRQYGAKYDTASLVRQAQAGDVRAAAARAQRAAIADTLEAKGVTGDRAAALARDASAVAADALIGMDSGDRRKDDVRNQKVGAAVRAKLAASGVPLSEGESLALAEGGWGALDAAAHRDPRLRGFGTALKMLEAVDPTTLARQRAITEENRAQAAMRSSLAALGQAGPLARLSDAVQAPGGDVAGFVGKLLGGQAPADVLAAVAAGGGAIAGLPAGDRVKLMATALAGQLKGYEEAKAIADPAARSEALRGRQDTIDALIGGGGAAKARLDAEMKAAGVSPADLQAVLSGKAGNLDTDRRQLLAGLALAAGKGLADSAGDAGLTVGATFGAARYAEVAGASGRLDAGIAAAKALSGAGKDDAVREAGRHAGTFASGAQAGIDALLGSDANIHALGAGGLKLARGLRDAQLKLQHLADRKAGGDVGKLLASGDPEATALRQQLKDGLGDVARRQDSAVGAKAAMSDAERKEATEYQKGLAAPDADQNKAAIERLLKETGGRLGDDDAAQLAAELGEGGRGATARAALARGLDARKQLDAIAKKHGWDPNSLRDILRRGKKPADVSDDERAEVARLAGDAGTLLRAGKGDEGTSAKVYRDALESVRSKEAAGGEPGGAGQGGAAQTRITGRVTIEGNTMAFTDVRGTPAGRGSTPVGALPS